MVDRLLALLGVDPSLGGMITFGFRVEGVGRRITPQAALRGYRTPWGYEKGLLDEDGILRADLDLLPPESQVLLAERLDQGGLTLIASATAPPWAHLADRVAFLVAGPVPRSARGRKVSRDEAIPFVVAAALALGVEGHRAELFAMRAAEAICKLDGRKRLCEGDLSEAIALVLAPRAQVQTAPDQTPAPSERREGTVEQAEAPPVTVPISLIPSPPVPLRPALHGAPVRSVPARRKQGTLDLVGTLLAALPWQRLRGASPPPLKVGAGDLRWHLRRPKQGRLVIFAVDGSGSMGARRLGQAKGAVLRLLQQAYRSRDHVALIVAAGNEARLLLPPARAVEQARRSLIGLPAGGGTPLTDALLHARQLAVRAKGRDGRPTVLVLCTDGRANRPITGKDRSSVRDDLRRAALALRSAQVRTVMLAEPGAEAVDLCKWLGATLQVIGRRGFSADALTKTARS